MPLGFASVIASTRRPSGNMPNTAVCNVVQMASNAAGSICSSFPLAHRGFHLGCNACSLTQQPGRNSKHCRDTVRVCTKWFCNSTESLAALRLEVCQPYRGKLKPARKPTRSAAAAVPRDRRPYVHVARQSSSAGQKPTGQGCGSAYEYGPSIPMSHGMVPNVQVAMHEESHFSEHQRTTSRRIVNPKCTTGDSKRSATTHDILPSALAHFCPVVHLRHAG
jgi:hypothetical protein